jgi:hypothetical protein
MEAARFRLLLDPCQLRDSTPQQAQVVCTYAFHALGSDEVGRGPFGGNSISFAVRDGEITAASENLPFGTNGFATQMWEPFAVWVVSEHPQDAEIMYEDWPGTTQAATSDPSIELWAERTADYVAAVQQGSTQ